MPLKRPKARPRKPRADAQRNRTRILEIAKDAFARSGANISLDEVARQAHIGAGTLYRHFPTRDSLLEAVYRTEVESWRQQSASLVSPCLRPKHCGRGCYSLSTIATNRLLPRL